jgi:hypothetical protein
MVTIQICSRWVWCGGKRDDCTAHRAAKFVRVAYGYEVAGYMPYGLVCPDRQILMKRKLAGREVASVDVAREVRRHDNIAKTHR